MSDASIVTPSPENVVGLLVMLDHAGVMATSSTAVRRPFESHVNCGVFVGLPTGPPAVMMLARVMAPDALADPSKDTDHEASPVMPMLRGVVNLAALPVMEA